MSQQILDVVIFFGLFVSYVCARDCYLCPRHSQRFTSSVLQSMTASKIKCRIHCINDAACIGFSHQSSDDLCELTSDTSTLAQEAGFVAYVASFCKDRCKNTMLGHEYVGKLAVTEHGNTCQRWDSQSPHTHDIGIDSSWFPEDDAMPENYCRNPDNGPHGPWCFTTNPDARWEYCDVPFCNC